VGGGRHAVRESTQKLEDLIRSGRPPRSLPASCPKSLRAIVAKALAPDQRRRYGSAREFQADLQAFLEHRAPVAELERRSSWSPNATIEAARAYLRKATRSLRRARRSVRAGTAAAWFTIGMGLWIGGSWAWQWFEASHVSSAAAGAPDLMLPMLYVKAADQVFDEYRTSADPSLNDFDWQKAEVCLARAVELGSGDANTRGKLALAEGYAVLERLGGGQYTDAAAGRLREHARERFANAAMQLPGDPAPHLALARLYVYSRPFVEQAMSEFETAAGLGAVLGRREIEQKGDAYRLRALDEFENLEWDAAERDAQQARRYYEKISRFDQADAHLREVNSIRRPSPTRKARKAVRWR
jgi:hypothetical protein